MIPISPIAEKLAASGCQRVLGVLEYSALENAPAQLPAHFVVPRQETAGPNRFAGGQMVDQRVTAEFQVIIVTHAQAARSELPSEELKALVDKVKGALIGWTIPGTELPVEYAGGQLLSAGGREAVWSCRFRTAYHERTQVQ